ncbi:hypothetical protein GCM10010168_77840 [Actinoplanes ianthinogenes]|uniref:FHA domain-containing protein n=1 Tax=Actinoplanes ianthinogenes TaxID=122358 RepID=A0ABM7LKH2_9ACTN|nr:FHA domain-containing protein [Actinoplanes ianthinogenes]BCJ39760.1 hypothetical protein Aiant_04170 [Actinoplanes ianthinogenes]GGR47558.1 hypothetical protein GCM10010168_77840 [Actinoplanes ianthinogenes]
MATLICPIHGPQSGGGSLCSQPGCMEFLQPEPVCPEPGCGNPLNPDGSCPLHSLTMAAEAAAYAPPTTRESGLFRLEFPFGPVAVGSDEVPIGRAEELGAIAQSLKDYDKVSRRHAIVWVEGGDLFVRDLGSTNGTYVNDRQVEHGDRRQLHDGDELRFSSTVRARVRRAAA